MKIHGTASNESKRNSNFMFVEPIKWQLLIFTQNNPANVFYCNLQNGKRVSEWK